LKWRIILEEKLNSPTNLPKITCGTTVIEVICKNLWRVGLY
jgi:hypothetical protein